MMARGFRRGGPFGGFDEGGGRQRQPRGDIKFVLLEMLQEQPRHGYELIKALEERSGGFYRPSPGLVYPTLQLLEEEGNLTSEMINDRRIYTITDAGRKLLAERETAQPQGRGPGRGFGFNHGPRHSREDMPQLLELRMTMGALAESVMQVARYGTPAQLQAVQALLNKTKQDVHLIMANDGGPKQV
jgi:DNA-binding PadR family transcriptional regulator